MDELGSEVEEVLIAERGGERGTEEVEKGSVGAGILSDIDCERKGSLNGALGAGVEWTVAVDDQVVGGWRVLDVDAQVHCQRVEWVCMRVAVYKRAASVNSVVVERKRVHSPAQPL